MVGFAELVQERGQGACSRPERTMADKSALVREMVGHR